MQTRGKFVAGLAVLLAGAVAGQAYERELNSRSLRDAYFLGKDNTFRSEQFLKDYGQTFPAPEEGVHVERIEMVTPFKEMVNRARTALDGYNPVQAEAEYQRQAPLLAVRVTLNLTPSYPAHSPFTVPIFIGPIYLRSPDFWQELDYHLVQAGEISPVSLRGEPFYSCAVGGPCWLAGATVTLVYDPERVASRPTRFIILTPDGQRVEAEFDLAKLR
ncbi:MAG: hypothetical protein HY656_07065 [Acidobacteria bacterium]|nr:hypothetical protein [Acidobacteriota bacterium]